MAVRFADLADAARWYEAWLADAALPLWAKAGWDAGGGLFQEALSVEGVPADLPRRSRAQARQVFVFASAANAGLGGRWLEVARQAYRRFLAVYPRPHRLVHQPPRRD